MGKPGARAKATELYLGEPVKSKDISPWSTLPHVQSLPVHVHNGLSIPNHVQHSVSHPTHVLSTCFNPT